MLTLFIRLIRSIFTYNPPIKHRTYINRVLNLFKIKYLNYIDPHETTSNHKRY